MKVSVGLDLAGEAQEERPGVSRQGFEPPDERVEIEPSVDLQQRHSRAPVGARNRDPVDDRLRHARTGAEDRRDFERGDVLALPAKSVADAIDERVEAVGVATHEIAGSHPRVSRLEDVAQDFLFRLDGFAVALETSGGIFADASQGLADFAVGAALAKTVGASRGHLRIVVETRERDRVAEREVRRDPADRSDLAFDVVEPDIAFRRSIKFEDAEWSETVQNGAPNLF